jgi:hypothetical protein
VLRLILGALVAANLLFFGFTRGWFDGLFGLSSIDDREPARIAAQQHPDIIVLTPMPAASAVAKAGCLEAGPIAAADSAAAEAALRSVLTPGAWMDTRNESIVAGSSVVVSHTYRVGNVDAAMAARLVALRLDPSGHAFSACAKKAPDATR